MYKKVRIPDSCYTIDTNGVLMSTRGKGLKMKPKFKNGNYIYILTIKKKKVSYKISRLVAEFFLPNENNDLYVKFKDGDISNPEVSNLEWTSKQNKKIYMPYKIQCKCPMCEQKYTMEQEIEPLYEKLLYKNCQMCRDRLKTHKLCDYEVI